MYRCYTRPICYITITAEIYVLQITFVICVIKFVVKKIAMCNQSEKTILLSFHRNCVLLFYRTFRSDYTWQFF